MIPLRKVQYRHKSTKHQELYTVDNQIFVNLRALESTKHFIIFDFHQWTKDSNL